MPSAGLDQALNQLARTAGIDIVSTEQGLGRVRSRPVTGAATARAALDQMLDGTGYRAVPIDARSFRVVRGAASPASPAPPAPASIRRPAAKPPATTDIVVTASKQRVPLLRYPGSLTLIGADDLPPPAETVDLTRVARSTPVLQTTEFGPGRNKIFIRGIADSSFDGATQSTVSVYFGDVQLGYSGADPSIKLYDVTQVEVMEGPQGTLYGSGSIGGIIRIYPAEPVLGETSGSVTGGVTVTPGGGPGGDLAGTLNLPIAGDTLAARAVAYRTRDGGFVDDAGRRLADVNAIDTTGGRLALRWAPGGGWQVVANGLYQGIDAADAGYADSRVGPLARRSAIAQPFDNEVGLGSLTVTKHWASGLQLLSATGVSTYHSHDAFDASLPLTGATAGFAGPPQLYALNGAKLLVTQETRLSRSLASGTSWVIGFSLLRSRDAENRALGQVAAPAEIIGVTNVTRSASAFAEGTLAVLPSLSVTVGGRFTYARTDGEPSFRPAGGGFVLGRSTRRFDPTVGFSWRIADHLAAYGRFQTGYRTGGLAVARGVGRVADFGSDSIRVGEIGLRRLRSGERGLSVTAAASFARWTDIQADIVNRRGLPYTANIGNARVQAFEASADWVPVRGLHATGSVLQTYNVTSGEMADLASPAHRRLPETPSFAGMADVSYRWAAAGGELLVGGSVRRVGRSVLGTGDLLDLSQGRYTALGLRAGWTRRRYELTLTAENLTNAGENLFASGNPFGLATRAQRTPLRPLSVRLGGTVGF